VNLREYYEKTPNKEGTHQSSTILEDRLDISSSIEPISSKWIEKRFLNIIVLSHDEFIFIEFF
jgi:hypothetical protein